MVKYISLDPEEYSTCTRAPQFGMNWTALRRRIQKREAAKWYRLHQGQVTEHPTIALALEPLDHGLSPLTGLVRDTWLSIACGLLENLLQYTEDLSQPLRLPASEAAGYPRLSWWGRSYGEQLAYCEAYARSLLLAACVLKNRPDLRMNGRSVAEYYRALLIEGTRNSGSASFGLPEGRIGGKQMVEATLMIIALRTAPHVLWSPFSSQERSLILTWFERLAGRDTYRNNWRWFSVLINTFLKLEGARYHPDLVQHALHSIQSMYVDCGWFRDGDAFDFYSAWSMQVYPLLWAEWDGASDPAIRDQFYNWNDEFLQSFPHIFSRDGHMPAWGRSLCYRFAATAPLALAFRRTDRPGIDPGFARRLCSGNLLQFILRPTVLHNGLLTLGFYEEDPSLIDYYSCVASPYWSSKLFLALTLNDDSPFWTSSESEGFWTDPPTEVHLGKTGMWVEHDRTTGVSRLHAPQKARSGDPRYHSVFFSAGHLPSQPAHFG